MTRVLKSLLLILSLMVVFVIRAHHILALPVFVDESLHILRAQVVFQFSDAVSSFLPGKLLTYYFFGLFNPQNHNGLWITRESIALLAPLSAALCYAIVRHLTGSFRAGIVVIWLYAFTPFMLFFERMALSDPFTGVFVLALVWSSLHFARRPTAKWAVVCGTMLGLALLAKLTALPLAVVPPLAWWMFSGRRGVRYTSPLQSNHDAVSVGAHRRAPLPSGESPAPPQNAKRLLMICYGVTALLMLLPGLYVIYQEVAQIDEKREVVATSLLLDENHSRIEQISSNLRTYNDAIRHLTEPLYFILMVALLAAVLRPRENGFLLVVFSLVAGFLVVVSVFPGTRYLTIAFPLLLMVVAISLNALYEMTRRSPVISAGFLVIVTAAGIWFMLFAAGFIRDAWRDPARLELGSQDEWEYFSHTSSGYALRDIAGRLSAIKSDEPILVEGIVGSCHSLRFYFPENSHLTLYCPYFGFYDNPALSSPDEWNAAQNGDGVVFTLIEPTGEFIPAGTQPSLFLMPRYLIFDRPHQGVPVFVYVRFVSDD